MSSVKRHLLGDPGDLSTDDREPPGCSLFLPTVNNTIPIPQNTKCHTNENSRPTCMYYLDVRFCEDELVTGRAGNAKDIHINVP